MTVTVLAVILPFAGLVPATIAWTKGHSFLLWWLYGATLFVVALPHAILTERIADDTRDMATESRRCPHCDGRLSRYASRCRQCGHTLSDKSGPDLQSWNGEVACDPASGPSFDWDEGFARISRMGSPASGRGRSPASRSRRTPVVAAVVASSVGAVVVAIAVMTSNEPPFPSNRLDGAHKPKYAEKRPVKPDHMVPQPLAKQHSFALAPPTLQPQPEKDPAETAAEKSKPAPSPPDSEYPPPAPSVRSDDTPREPSPPASTRAPGALPSEAERKAAETASEKDGPAMPASADHSSSDRPEPASDGVPAGLVARSSSSGPSGDTSSEDAVKHRVTKTPDASHAIQRTQASRAAAAEDETADPVRFPSKDAKQEEYVQAVGEVVAWIQSGLKEFGYYDGPIDGRAGLRTQAAIRAYQRSHHLTPHGHINQALLVSLRRSLDEVRRQAAQAPR